MEQGARCPFCSYHVKSFDHDDTYRLRYHIEEHHPEDLASPFAVRDAPLPTHPGSPRRPSSYASPNGFLSPYDSPPRRRGSELETPRRSSTSRDRHYPARAEAQRRSSSARSSASADFVECPHKDCGEHVKLVEYNQHLALHEQEAVSLEDLVGYGGTHSKTPSSRDAQEINSGHRHQRSSSQDHRTVLAFSDTTSGLDDYRPSSSRYDDQTKKTHKVPWIDHIFRSKATVHDPVQLGRTQDKGKRLGKAELGPHAFEDRMPEWLWHQLQDGAPVRTETKIGLDGRLVKTTRRVNEVSGVINVLAQLCEQDHNVTQVFLCHPSTKHIFKMPREGGFCGYRNIEMLVSFMQGTQYPGYEHFSATTPSIPLLQDLIENAWSMGFNSSGRVETGGIRGTRKYIGTPEAQALFGSLDIPCEANAFITDQDNHDVAAYERVLEAVLAYFTSIDTDPTVKIHRTGLAPIYFQHPGHSLTIVGLEIRKSGSLNLLVFDPMFKTSSGIIRLLGTTFKAPAPEKLLKAFRRGDEYLEKYKTFEILKLLSSNESR